MDAAQFIDFVVDQAPALVVAMLWVRHVSSLLSDERVSHRDTLNYYRECQKEQMSVLTRHIDHEQRQ